MIAISRGGNLTAASDQVILSQSSKIFEASNSNSSSSDSPQPSLTLSGRCFDFSFSFPTYIMNGRDPLAPSQSLSQQGAHCSVDYAVKIDVIRKGLRRHERWAFLSALARAGVAWGSLLHTNQLSGLGYRLCICPAQPHLVKSSWT